MRVVISHGLGLSLFIVAAVLAGFCKLSTAQTIDSAGVEHELQKTTQLLDELKTKLARSETLKLQVSRSLARSQTALDDRQKQLQKLHEDISRYDNQLAGISRQIDASRQSIAAVRRSLADALRVRQMLGQRSRLKLLLDQRDPAQASRFERQGRYLYAAQEKHVQQHLDLLRVLDQSKATVRKDRQWLEDMQQTTAHQLEQYALESLKQQQKLADLERNMEQDSVTLRSLEEDHSRLMSLMEELADSGPDAFDFNELKGKLGMPVSNGQIAARFGDRKPGTRLRWNGLFINAPANSQVKAVAPGNVIYSDWLQGFGMLVIVEHGDGYMSLYGGNRTVEVEPGDGVESGSTIATVGDSGGQTSSGLYFEIRQNATALDPANWLKGTSS